MRSLATSVKAQGVGSAYVELIHLLTKYGNHEITFSRHGLSQCDVLHCHTLDPVSFLYMKRSKKPTVASVHFVPETMKGSLRLPKPIQQMFNAYMLSFYRSADYLHIVHPDTAKVLENYGISKDRIFCIPNVVAADGFMKISGAQRAELRKKLGYRKNDFIVTGSGQLQTKKGILTFADVARKLPDVKFVWAGGFSFGALSDGHAELKSLLKNPPDNLFFTGIIPRQEVCELLNAADVFFLPSFHEQFSMSILEAAATGTPVLLRDLPSYKTVYGERYLHGSSVEDFVRMIRQLQSDKDYIKHMSVLSEEISEIYGEKKIYEMWKAAYIKCAAAGMTK